MRKFAVLAVLFAGMLSVSPAAAQYVTPPGSAPSAGAAGFGVPSAEVQGETVEGTELPPEVLSSQVGPTGTGAAAGAASGASTGAPRVLDTEATDLVTEAATAPEEGRSLLALTGLNLLVLALVGAGLYFGGRALKQVRTIGEA